MMETKMGISDVMQYLPTLTIILSSLINMLRWDKLLEVVNTKQWAAIHLMISTILFALPPHSAVASFGRSLTLLIAKWPYFFPHAPAFLIHGGPLGHSCAKGEDEWIIPNCHAPFPPFLDQTFFSLLNLVSVIAVIEVIAAIILWKLSRGNMPPLELGPWPDAPILLLVLFISAVVNLVLWLWSRSFLTRGNHDGVNQMVASSVGRSLSRAEHVNVAVSAVVNAVSEEVMSRGVWRLEFERSVHPPMSSTGTNILQALVFGIWHYYGIPSGVAGVVLTFGYGLIMGLLMDYGKGLLLPILAHSIADYFIFAIIARQKQLPTGKSKES
jgi:membrane protease YdiL (CAAX protease family)